MLENNTTPEVTHIPPVEEEKPIVVKVAKEELSQLVSERTGISEKEVELVLETLVNIQLEKLKVEYV